MATCSAHTSFTVKRVPPSDVTSCSVLCQRIKPSGSPWRPMWPRLCGQERAHTFRTCVNSGQDRSLVSAEEKGSRMIISCQVVGWVSQETTGRCCWQVGKSAVAVAQEAWRVGLPRVLAQATQLLYACATVPALGWPVRDWLMSTGRVLVVECLSCEGCLLGIIRVLYVFPLCAHPHRPSTCLFPRSLCSQPSNPPSS